jgi:hypothetical protein
VVFNFSLVEELNRQAGLLGTILPSLSDYALAHTDMQQVSLSLHRAFHRVI